MITTNDAIQARKNEILKTKMGWKIAHNDFTKLNGFKYLCFAFKFDICDKNQMNEFNTFVLGQQTPLPIDVCNFFLIRNINYQLSFRYDKTRTPRENFLLWRHVRYLNKQKKLKERKK